MALEGQLCNLTHFAILFSKSSHSVPSEKKPGNQTLYVCKAHDSSAWAKEIWHVWTPHPEKSIFFSLSPFTLSFFSSQLPTTSWGLSHRGSYSYQQWNTETPFTAAELVSCLEFGFTKASCLLLESSRTCVHSLRIAHKESSVCSCCSKPAQLYTAESLTRGHCCSPVTLEQWDDARYVSR